MTERGADDETRLVRRCADGDEAAWTAFVDGYGTLIAALARRMLARRVGTPAATDVDEVVADVFLALLRRDRHLLHAYDPRWRLSTYLGVICRTAVVRLLRRRGRLTTPLEAAPEAEAPEPNPTPLGALTSEERTEALARLRAGLDALGRRDRLILKLRFLDGLDYQAIAAALGVKPASVGPLLHRAKRRLKARVPELEAWLEP